MTTSPPTVRRPLILVPVPRVAVPPDPAPHIDYFEIAAAVGGNVAFAEVRRGGLPVIEKPLRRFGVHQAARARRSDASCFVSMSGQSALALALLNPSRPHVAVLHRATSPRRRALQRWTRWLQRLDRVVVLSRTQEAYLRDEVGLPAERVRFLYDKVDHRFFTPQDLPQEDFVLSVGQTQRDYGTLFTALRMLETPAVVVASSPWTGDASAATGHPPPRVTVARGMSATTLRDLYARAAVVVVPLFNGLDFAAGVNGVLEAMAMRKPLIVSATPGLAGYVEDGINARLVTPEHPESLRDAIAGLLSDRRQADQLAAAGHAIVEEGRNLDTFVAEMAAIVREVTPEAQPPRSIHADV